MKKIHREVISSEAFNLLKDILSNKNFSNFYLVGGTALALQIGHRKSHDLDLFSQKEFKSNVVKNIDYKYRIISLHDNSIELDIKDNKLFLFYFAFPLYKRLIIKEGLRVAHPVDIGLMKLLSLQGRTIRKDIIDLYFIDKEVIKLEKLLKIFESHYPKESFNSYDSLKTLIDTSHLAKQPILKMLRKCQWEDCWKSVKNKIANHIREFVKVGSNTEV